MLKKTDAIRKEHRKDKWNSYYVYIYRCIKCLSREIICRNPSKHDGLCSSCAHQTNRPFESQYKSLLKDSRGYGCDMTYDDYIKFTNIKNCHYCEDEINWLPYPTVDSIFISRSYYLDRTDNSKGYSVGNCVVCCTDCNRIKSNRFSYEEFMLMSPALKTIKINRKQFAQI